MTTEEIRSQGLVWINRGNDLAAGDAIARAAAPAAYDRAIGFFARLPLEANPYYRNHLGAAWLNRGHAGIALGRMEAARDALENAVAVLKLLPLEQDPHFRLNLTGAYANLAHALAESDPVRARREAEKALGLLAPVETGHVAFAEMGLRARRAWLMAGSASRNPALVDAGIELAEDGLRIARLWESRGVARLRPLAARLFRLGAQLYREHQPHFLVEFVAEHLSPAAFGGDGEFSAAAEEALTLAKRDLGVA